MKIRLDVVYRKQTSRWYVVRDRVPSNGAGHDSFVQAWGIARLGALALMEDGHAVSVYRHRRDGRLRKDGERTFPRSADPRRSPG